MKRNSILLITACLLVVNVLTLQAQHVLKVKNSKITVQGTSSLHDWESDVTAAEWKGHILIENNALKEIQDIEIKIPVESIKSTKGKMMDNKTYDAFKYQKFPVITYTLTAATINEATGTIDAKGKLTMAGVTKPVDIRVNYKASANGELQIKVSQKLKMTDFKMDPPTAMMGTIKVGDEVTVNFDLILISTKSI